MHQPKNCLAFAPGFPVGFSQKIPLMGAQANPEKHPLVPRRRGDLKNDRKKGGRLMAYGMLMNFNGRSHHNSLANYIEL